RKNLILIGHHSLPDLVQKSHVLGPLAAGNGLRMRGRRSFATGDERLGRGLPSDLLGAKNPHIAWFTQVPTRPGDAVRELSVSQRPLRTVLGEIGHQEDAVDRILNPPGWPLGAAPRHGPFTDWRDAPEARAAAFRAQQGPMLGAVVTPARCRSTRRHGDGVAGKRCRFRPETAP